MTRAARSTWSSARIWGSRGEGWSSRRSRAETRLRPSARSRKNYSPGELIQPERDYPRAGLARGELYEVLDNRPGNRLTVRGEAGQTVEFSPMTCRRLSIYETASG